eukprot:XP_001695183.1 predicted protein [Chlamydomonas reinhardtii]
MADEHFGVTPSSLNSIPIFDPRQDDPRQWLDKIERHARVFQWSNVDKLLVARCRLSGDAQTWESGIDGDMRDWPEFRAMFLERFAPGLEELFNRLSNCRQGRNESVRRYADRYRSLVAQLNINPACDPTYMYSFLRGLHPDVYQQVYLMRPANLDDAITNAIYVREAGVGLMRDTAPACLRRRYPVPRAHPACIA